MWLLFSDFQAGRLRDAGEDLILIDLAPHSCRAGNEKKSVQHIKWTGDTCSDAAQRVILVHDFLLRGARYGGRRGWVLSHASCKE